jgi:hypothetical protein
MAGIESDALIEMASRGPAADKQVRNATLWPPSQGHLAQRPFWGKFRLRLREGSGQQQRRLGDVRRKLNGWRPRNPLLNKSGPC